MATITALLFIYEGTNNLHYIMLYLWPNIKPCPWDAGDAKVLSIAKNHTNHKFRLDVIKLVQTLCD